MFWRLRRISRRSWTFLGGKHCSFAPWFKKCVWNCVLNAILVWKGVCEGWKLRLFKCTLFSKRGFRPSVETVSNMFKTDFFKNKATRQFASGATLPPDLPSQQWRNKFSICCQKRKNLCTYGTLRGNLEAERAGKLCLAFRALNQKWQSGFCCHSCCRALTHMAKGTFITLLTLLTRSKVPKWFETQPWLQPCPSRNFWNWVAWGGGRPGDLCC